jgi:hypothetical protein
MSPTARSLKFLRDAGMLAAVVETWIPKVNKRRDLFGGFDILAIDPREKRTWLVQTTSASNLSARVKKLQGLAVVPKLLAAGIRCEAHGWAKKGERWEVRRIELKGKDCTPVEASPPRQRGGGRRMTQAGLFDESS